MTKWITHLQVLRATTYRRPRGSTLAAGAAIAMFVALVQAAPAVGARSLPDLTVSSVSDPPSAIVTGTPFIATATTTNAARHPTRDSLTRFYLSTDAARGPSDVALSGAIAVKPLKKHHPSQTASVALTLAAAPAAGTYRLLACADDTKRVDEFNESNNCRASAGTVSFGSQPEPEPEPDPEPTPEPGPSPSGASSQALIQADLDAGRIDYGTSLIYRAWSLFWDARLPARYDGAGSTGEDLSLFSEIRAALPGLPPDQQAELGGWIARPTDPLSPFGPAAAGTATRATAAADPSLKCGPTFSWLHRDYPDDNSNSGFRAWICAPRQADADTVLNPVLTDFAGIEQLFTEPEPAGMGRPVPDTLAEPDNGGNGKIDVYLVGTNQCRDRNGDCVKITGDEAGLAVPDGPIGKAPGFPERSSSGYIVVGLANAFDTLTLAHELFHILQFAHTVGAATSSWYTEASATWAEWHPSLRHLSKKELYDKFSGFQESNLSLLDHSPLDHQYESWIWPLFQELQVGGATEIYQTWASAESASDRAGIDRALNSRLPFADYSRDFSVWNLQPGEYFFNGSGTGLESVTWQSRITDFPRLAHVRPDAHSIGLGPHSIAATVNVLAAGYDRFIVTDPRARQITIDLSPLENVGSANLDIVGQIASDSESHRWRRIEADSSTYTFCRDVTDDDFDLFYVVVSNHAWSRTATGAPDAAAAVTGFYNVTAQDHCDVPVAYKGTFKVTTTSSPGPSLIDFNVVGNVTFKYFSTEATCGTQSAPTVDALHYCYVLDSAQETWTAPEVTTDRCKYVPHEAPFSYANDQGRNGTIDITLRNPNPAFSNIYHVWHGDSTKTMIVDVTDLDPANPCEEHDTFTIRLPFYSIISSGCYNETPPARFSGWPLSGSCTFQDGRDVITTTTWSWDLSPVFQQ